MNFTLIFSTGPLFWLSKVLVNCFSFGQDHKRICTSIFDFYSLCVLQIWNPPNSLNQAFLAAFASSTHKSQSLQPIQPGCKSVDQQELLEIVHWKGSLSSLDSCTNLPCLPKSGNGIQLVEQNKILNFSQ